MAALSMGLCRYTKIVASAGYTHSVDVMLIVLSTTLCRHGRHFSCRVRAHAVAGGTYCRRGNMLLQEGHVVAGRTSCHRMAMLPQEDLIVAGRPCYRPIDPVVQSVIDSWYRNKYHLLLLAQSYHIDPASALFL